VVERQWLFSTSSAMIIAVRMMFMHTAFDTFVP
jgi:hypothetical protein